MTDCKTFILHRHDVLDGEQYIATCHTCAWEAAPAHNYQLAAIRADQHKGDSQ